MDRENAINKILGALAIANNSSNRAEIETASRMVQNLLAKYNLDLHDIKARESTPVVTKHFFQNGKNNSSTLGGLAFVLGKYNFVHVYTTHLPIEDNGQHMVVAAIAFVGREFNVDTVIDLFHKMRFAISRLSEREFKNAVTGTHGKAWKASFELGVLNGLRSALEKEQALFLQMKSELGISTGRELVISLDNENKEYLQNSGLSFKKKPGAVIRNRGAYENGYEHGQRMSTKEYIS